MKKVLAILLPLIFFATVAWGAGNDFVNGNFETGTFAGWTLGGGEFTTNYDDTIQYFSNTGDPGKSAIVTPGLDVYSGNHINQVFMGSYAGRINNYDDNYHYSNISQTVTNYGWSDIYFAWAAVLEYPTDHPKLAQPFFSLDLMDLTTNTDLYNKAFTAADNLSIFKDANYGDWLYTDWQAVHLQNVPVGHDLQLTLTAADCSWGGHGGYAYLDNIGHEVVTTTPEPATMLLLGLGLIGIAGVRKKFKN